MIFLDLETTANGGPDGDSPEAHWSVNKVLLCGWMDDPATGIFIDDDCSALAGAIQRYINDDGQCTLVAHNAKFDIKYLMRDHPEIEWEYVRVWDTMTWEYLNSGHRETMVSLENTASKYGIKFSKSLDLGALLSKGIKMEDIPKEELEAYLIDDVRVLHHIFEAQAKQCNLFWMDYILPLAEMELNGLPLDIPKAEALAVKLQGEIDDSYEYLRDYIIGSCEWQDGSAIELDDFTDLVRPKSKLIKPTANRTLSFLLTGAPEELKITPKWRVCHKGTPLLNSTEVENIYQDIEPTHVGYPMDEDAVDRINREMHADIEMLEHLIRHRKATKIVNTYLLPMLRQAKIEGTVHPKLNTAITATGRLSSSQPNGQNMPPEVRELIVTGHGGELEEVDFSQLEMVGAATCSGCKELIYDLGHGVDVHKNTATKVFGAAQAETKRKLAKNVNFGVLYGGKATGLSKQTGVDRTTVQELIDAFYDAYPGVAKWQRSLFENVVDNMEAHDVKNGEQRYHSDYTLPVSGRKFRFIESEAPAWVRRRTGRSYSFSPNHTANYPIQGFAGGDIVMYGLWYVWQDIRSTYNRIYFRLTVHDSILLEKPSGWVLDAHYNNMNRAIESRFKLPIKLHVDVESGPNWR